MDESVLAAMGKWPNVPAASGWLSLDERGHWQLRDEPITHSGLIEFINRNYESDDAGRWFFQNGPQRVYVSLAYTPLVLHVDTDGTLRNQAGHAVSRVETARVDEEGNLLLGTDAGVGLVVSDALPRVSEWLVGEDGTLPADDALEGLRPDGATQRVWLAWSGEHIPLLPIARAEVAGHFGFASDPQPPG